MPGVQKRSLQDPDELTVFERGEARVVQLGELSLGQTVQQPGWHWAEHIRPIVGTPSCQHHHIFIMVSGHARVKMDDGTVHDFGPDDVGDVPPGHDAWVVGDEPVVTYEIAGIRGFGRPPSPGERVLTTLLFTDIVDSTPLAERLGDVRWKELLGSYYQSTRNHLDRFRGHEITTTGDGILASFDGPARAIKCGEAMIGGAANIDVRIRVGVHTGEVEWAAGNVRGLAVHIAARVLALAGPGEILVSATTRELVSGSDLTFEDRGVHQLKGVAEPRRLFAVTR